MYVEIPRPYDDLVEYCQNVLEIHSENGNESLVDPALIQLLTDKLVEVRLINTIREKAKSKAMDLTVDLQKSAGYNLKPVVYDKDSLYYLIRKIKGQVLYDADNDYLKLGKAGYEVHYPKKGPHKIGIDEDGVGDRNHTHNSNTGEADYDEVG